MLWPRIRYRDIKTALLCSICGLLVGLMCRLHLDTDISRSEVNSVKREDLLYEKEQLLQNAIESFLQELLVLRISLAADNEIQIIDEQYGKFQKILNALRKPVKIQNNRTIQKLRHKNNAPNAQASGFTFDISQPSASNFTAGKGSLDSKNFYSCGEDFKGSLHGYPSYKTGFVRQKCDKSSLKASLSLVLDRPQLSRDAENYITSVFGSVYVITEPDDRLHIKSNNIYVRTVSDNSTAGALLNAILNEIKTPFVLVAPFLRELDNKTDLERLIHIHELSRAQVIGAATKNIYTGKWDRGCYQSKLRFYTLTYTQEYYKSMHECLICQHTDSPFLASREFLLQRKFNKHFTYGVYRDFFLRLSSKEKLLVCPDVMFYTYQPAIADHHLVTFAEAWDIKKIVSNNGTVTWFGCRNGFSHTSKKRCPVKKGMAVPPCCRANLADAIVLTFSLCKQYNIHCELQEGSVLGAVKFRNVLPWERDADISILSRDFFAFKNLSLQFSEAGYVLIVDEQPEYFDREDKYKGGVLHIRAHGWSVQVFGQSMLTTNSSNARTKIKFGQHWIPSPENPGQYARNRYGVEMYKHSEHWMSLGYKDGWQAYQSGNFSECSQPGHHACLDQEVADGDLNF